MNRAVINPANIISLSRALLAIPIIISISHHQKIVFFWVALAVLSDWLDGFVARKYQYESAFGALLDPIADFIVISAVMTYFVLNGYISTWLWWLMFVRYASIFIVAMALLQFTAVELRSNFLGKCSVCVFSVYGLTFLLGADPIYQSIIESGFIFLLCASWYQYLSTYASSIRCLLRS